MNQVGQAVICQVQGLMFVQGATHDTIIDCDNLDGIEYAIAKGNTRSATVDEILAEIQKHGWVYSEVRNNWEAKFLSILKWGSAWTWLNIQSVNRKELKEYCEEGLIAHRIITALNLAK
jgi:hypothetical protein